MAKGSRSRMNYNVLLVAFLCFVIGVAGLVYFKTDLFRTMVAKPEGLSGLVAVRGPVSLKQLNFSQREIRAINRAVAAHRNTFVKVDMILAPAGNVDEIKENTLLVFAVSLKTASDLEVKSWSRKLQRKKLVGQFVDYLRKAAAEYEEFQKFPDVKKNFKTLYI